MNTYYVAGLPCSDELYHHGILGQKWGVRRFQNPDGSLTTAGRARYNVGKVAGKVRTKAGNAAKSATTYVKRRTKMKHPSLMTDDELRTYTQRLIAEKNYSDALARAQSATSFGRAEKFVGDIVTAVPKAAAKGLASIPQGAVDALGRGLNTIADTGFRKLAQKITQTKSEREIERLQNELKKKQLADNMQDHEQQRQIDLLTRQNKLNDLQDQLVDRDGSQAERKEIEKLQREKQLRDLRKDLNSPLNDTSVSTAMQVMRNPENYSSADRSKAMDILKQYSTATTFYKTITGADDKTKPFKDLFQQTPAADSPVPSVEVSPQVPAAPIASPAPEPTYEMPRSYTPNTAPRQNFQDFSDYRMGSVDGTNGGMYGGRLRDTTMPTVESMGRSSFAPSVATPPPAMRDPAVREITPEERRWYEEYREAMGRGGYY